MTGPQGPRWGRWRRGGAAVALAASAALLAGGCGVLRDIFDPHHGQHCVSARDEWQLVPVQVGKRVAYIPEQVTVCDQWVPDSAHPGS